jgi:benzoate-CoA ligase family protein
VSAGLSFPAQLNVADYFLDRHLREGRGRRIAVAGVGPPLTYEELAEKTARVAGLLRELGLAPATAGRPGERVLLVLPDSPDWLACFYGAIKAGAVAVPVNPFTRAADYAYYAADSKPRLAVVHEMSFAEALPALRQAKDPPRVLTVGARVPNLRDCEFLDDLLASASPLREAQGTSADDIAFFLYTSGSSGQPKAAMHRHCHMLATSAAFAAHVLGIPKHRDDVCFSASKLFFAYGLGNAGYFPFSVGAATVLLPERVTPEKIFAVLKAHRPTLFFSVPTIYGALLRAAEGMTSLFDSVRLCISAGEALPAEILARFRERFGREILDGIGTTEMLHMFMSNRAGAARPGSCGPLVPGYEARIVDDEGREVKDGEIGNLWVRGPSAMAGYWERPELTARVLREGWYATGDQFSRDADGFYYYCGRADDMLKVSGLWVSPLEVENVLLAHGAVAEAAVVGQRDADGLTRIVAHVVPGSGRARACPLPPAEADSLAAELRSFVHARLPGYKVPQEFRFVSELPKTATGKIQRFKLRA